MSGATLVLVSYVLLAVFFIAFVYRSVKIARMPVHLRWELAPVPHEKGKGHYGGSYLEEPEWWSKPREKDHIAEITYMVKDQVQCNQVNSFYLCHQVVHPLNKICVKCNQKAYCAYMCRSPVTSLSQQQQLHPSTSPWPLLTCLREFCS